MKTKHWLMAVAVILLLNIIYQIVRENWPNADSVGVSGVLLFAMINTVLITAALGVLVLMFKIGRLIVRRRREGRLHR